MNANIWNIFQTSAYSFYTSGSQTFPMRGPLRIIWWSANTNWWSAKHKLAFCIRIRGPLRLITRTTCGPRSRLWESLAQKQETIHTGVRRRGQEGSLAPPWSDKIVCFSTFLVENSMFETYFMQICSMFLPPTGKFCPPLEKSLRTRMAIQIISDSP